jgi:hypothetical protein
MHIVHIDGYIGYALYLNTYDILLGLFVRVAGDVQPETGHAVSATPNSSEKKNRTRDKAKKRVQREARKLQ